MPKPNKASAVSAWWNAVKRFSELFEREVPAGRSPKAVFEKLADDLKLEVLSLKSQVEQMRPVVERYENGVLLKENTELRRRNSYLLHEVRSFREGNDALVLEVEALQQKVDRLEKRLRLALSRTPEGPGR